MVFFFSNRNPRGVWIKIDAFTMDVLRSHQLLCLPFGNWNAHCKRKKYHKSDLEFPTSNALHDYLWDIFSHPMESLWNSLSCKVFSPKKTVTSQVNDQRPPPGKLNHPHCHPASLVEKGTENIISCKFYIFVCFSMPSKTVLGWNIFVQSQHCTAFFVHIISRAKQPSLWFSNYHQPSPSLQPFALRIWGDTLSPWKGLGGDTHLESHSETYYTYKHKTINQRYKRA